ncbi:MAG: efflux RND transporter permease subunit [Burkholderiales bacterium]
MIKRIVAFALEQPLFVLIATALFIGAGVTAFKRLPVEAFPDVTDTQVTVITLFPGQAAEEVERQVTFPVEVALAGLPNAIRMFSHTQFGLSFVILTFDDKADAYFARQQVTERLRDVELPPNVQPRLAPMSTAIGEVYRYRVKGSGQQDLRELRSLQDWVIERQLRLIPGVAEVVPLGGYIKQYEVSPDLAKLKYYDISLQQLFGALERASTNAGGGYVEQGTQQFLIRGLGLLRAPNEILDVVVAERKGSPVLVRHIASLSVGAVPRQGVIGQDEDPDVVTGTVLMRRGESPAVVLAAIKEKVALLNERMLPKGVEIVPYYDRTWLLDKTLKTVFKNLAEGAFLVTLILLIFLGNLRAALIVAALIPLSLLGTFLGLTFLGVPANLLSLGAMDFGIIVDGAVIVVENVFRRLSENPGAVRMRDRLRVVLDATTEVGRPTLFSMLIIIAAHIPIFTLERHEGRIFAPMAYSVVSALAVSLAFSLTLVPLACLWLLRKKLPAHDNAVVQRISAVYKPALLWALAHKRIVVGTSVAALAVSLAVVPRLGTEFLPEINEGSIWLNVPLDPSISVTEASAQMKRIRDAIAHIPEINTIVYKAGRPEDGTDPKLVSMAEFLIDLKPDSEWTRKVSKAEVIQEMDRALAALPGVQASFSQPIRDNILESISQIDGQIVVKIFGPDLGQLRTTGREVLAAISDVPGVARAMLDRQGELPQDLIEIDRAQAARYGLNINDIADVIETALGGREATNIWEGSRRFAVVVRLKEGERTLSQMRDILLTTPGGAFIPLSTVATFRTAGGSMNISRENGGRVVAIGVFIQDRDMGSVVADMKREVAKDVKLPEGYTLSWSGEFENQERAMKRLSIIVPISILLIFILLFDAFNSFKSALLILLNIPLGMIGGIFALFVTGIPLSVSAAIGFIALFGQAVLNGVVMVSYFNQLKRAGATPEEAVVKGALDRLRAVLMTGLLAMFGLMPMALSHDIGAETQKPLAVVVIGGLISATILTLIVLPVLYVLFESRYRHGPHHGRRHA